MPTTSEASRGKGCVDVLEPCDFFCFARRRYARFTTHTCSVWNARRGRGGGEGGLAKCFITRNLTEHITSFGILLNLHGSLRLKAVLGTVATSPMSASTSTSTVILVEDSLVPEDSEGDPPVVKSTLTVLPEGFATRPMMRPTARRNRSAVRPEAGGGSTLSAFPFC